MKNEATVIDLINKMQAQLTALERKIDSLINRSSSAPEAKPADNSNDRNKGRMMHTAICADCKKECSIPFKPSGDRPVYCKDCFSRRKVINLSGIKVDLQPKEVPPVQAAPVKSKKKAVVVKKPITKKKLAPKKK